MLVYSQFPVMTFVQTQFRRIGSKMAFRDVTKN